MAVDDMQQANGVGIICGLMSEAAVVRSALREAGVAEESVWVGISGARAAEARGIAGRFADEGAAVLCSIGVSGGLDPALRPGDLIVADRVVRVDGAQVEFASARLRLAKSVAASLAGAPERILREGCILGSDVIIPSREEKARLFATTGAVAVDMESHAVAEVAAARGLDFVAIRAIADPSDRALPPPAMEAVAADGSTRVLSTLMKIAVEPRHFPALLRLGRDSTAALKALGAALPRMLREISAGMTV